LGEFEQARHLSNKVESLEGKSCQRTSSI